MSDEKWSVSDPGKHGFDDWMTTQAEASNSMTNCGCFHKNHSHPGRKPNGGYSDLVPFGDQCVVGSGFAGDWCYPCTDYFYPNASDPRGVSALSATLKVPGDDSTFLIDRFGAHGQSQRRTPHMQQPLVSRLLPRFACTLNVSNS